ncbi:MAG: transposase-like protein [Pirellulaceae bacterium]|jgi:transposase-like protein
MLVLMGATADGKKELIAVRDGFRESEQSWYELLIDLKQRGLVASPKVRGIGTFLLDHHERFKETFLYNFVVLID